ncbi:MAG: ornithine cyclodeaminase family protein [Sulfolobales archaeon]
MSNIKILLEKDINEIIDPFQLMMVIKDLYLKKPYIIERISIEYMDKWIGLMPGIDNEAGFVIKIIGIYPRAYPRVRGYIFVFDLENGEIKYVIDAISATGWRTATTSALATKLLLQCELEKKCFIETLGLIGAGLQGYYHLKIFSQLFELSKVLVYDINRENIENLKKRLVDIEVSYTERRMLLEKADVVIAATNSREPVVEGEYLKKGSVVISIGAPKPVRELDDIVKRRARCALVDTIEGVIRESEDVSNMILLEIGELLKGSNCSFGDIKLYKSVGTVLLDIAVTKHLINRLFSKS